MVITDNQHKALAQLVKTTRMLTEHAVLVDSIQCDITHQRCPFVLLKGELLERTLVTLAERGLADQKKELFRLTEAGLDAYALGPWNPATRKKRDNYV